MDRRAGIAARIFVALDRRPPYDLIDVLEEELRAAFPLEMLRVWLADYDETALQELTFEAGHGGASITVDTGNLGRAFRTQSPIVSDAVGADTTVIVPITMRSERFGVLELRGDIPAGQAGALAAVATAVAYCIGAARRYTDVFELARRRRELELPAEIQWELLPVLAHKGPDFSLAGSVEPAYDIGGDNFDYSVDADRLTVSLTDAVGHGTNAALMSTLAVSALRNARRRSVGLRQQVRAANAAIHEQFGGEAFATGMFLTVSRATGETLAVNAGHSMLWRLRGADLDHVDVPPDVPAGVFADAEFSAHPVDVRAGDRLVIVSDGVIEALDAKGAQFGVAGLARHLHDTSGAEAREVVRTLTRAVTDHASSTLADDATAVCVDYRR